MGYRPRPYQTRALAAIDSALARDSSTLLVLATGLGKAQPDDTPTPTPGGIVPFSSLRVGSEVFGSDGRPCRVTGIYPRGTLPVYRVEASDGANTLCCADHLWAVRTKSQKARGEGYRVKPLHELWGDLHDGSGAAKWFLPVAGPVRYPRRPLPMHPYLLGALLGDGTFAHHLGISSADGEIIARVSRIAAGAGTLRQVNAYDHLIQGTAPSGRRGTVIGNTVKAMGLWGKRSHQKFIPAAYLTADVPARLDLLRGLMDTDGTVRQDGHAEFSTTSRDLADGVCELVRSLGGCTRVRRKSPGRYTHGGEYRKGRPSYRVTVTLDGINPFWLDRKAEMANLHKRQGQTRAIVSITPAGEAECRCISVDSPDRLYITNDYIVTHNTVVFCHAVAREQSRSLILAHREELIEQAARKIEEETGETPAIEMGERTSDEAGSSFFRSKVVVSSVQTMSRPNRMARFNPSQFGLLVIDEAHHAVTRSYRKVIDHFAMNPDLKILGTTATPKRADQLAMSQVFDSVCYEYDIEAAIGDGYLVPIRQHPVRIKGLDFSGLKAKAGDFTEADLERILAEEPTAAHAVASATAEICGDLPTLVFCVSIKHAKLTAELIQRYRPGAAAIALSCNTPKDERRATVEAYKRGEVQYLCNVGLFLEGFDAPTTAAVVMARPTKSLPLYTQVIGRGTRPLPGVIDHPHLDDDAAGRKAAIAASGKPGMLVIDFVGNSGRHRIIRATDLLGGKWGEPVRAYAAKTQEEEDAPAGPPEAALERADAELALLAEIVERERRRNITGTVEYDIGEVSPFAHGSGGGEFSNGEPIQSERASEKQVNYLVYRAGWNREAAERLPKRKASGIIGSHRSKGA